MKKVLIVVVAVAVGFAFTSCKKNCNCSGLTKVEVEGLPPIEQKWTFDAGKLSKSDCEAFKWDLGTQLPEGATFTYECKSE